MAQFYKHSLLLFITLSSVHRIHAGDISTLKTMQQELRQYTRKAIAHSKRIEDEIITRIADKLEERFTEMNIELHAQKIGNLQVKKNIFTWCQCF